jgi:hypothetical protein
MKRLLLLTALLLVPTTATAESQNTTIQQLYEYCKRPHGSPQSLYCWGFISAAGQMMLEIGPEGPKRWQGHLGMCGVKPTDIITADAMVQAFLDTTEAFPELGGKPALSGVILALARTWPCPPK